MPTVHPDIWESFDQITTEPVRSKPRPWQPRPRHQRRPDGSEEFKCRHCRAFVGPTIFGGKHRNHCPRCLCSRRVDRSRPGDRASDCGALMPPIGTFHRPDGEQMLVHRCAGCGAERHNRIAADDDPVVLLRLPLVQPRRGKRADTEEQDQVAS